MMKNKRIYLGTALWGWKVDSKEVFNLLDYFYENKGRYIDTATNYPINKNPLFFRYAENLLESWIKTHGIHDLKILMKVGGVNNSGSSNSNLTFSYLMMCYQYYGQKFKNNFDNLSIHFDNRDQEKEIIKTIEALNIIKNYGTKIGLSGIKHPEIYVNHLDINHIETIQVKHNLIESDLDRYPLYKNKFVAYGITSGGFNFKNNYDDKSSFTLRNLESRLNQKIKNLSHFQNMLEGDDTFSNNYHTLGLINAFSNDHIMGVILGPSKLEQLKDSIQTIELIKGTNINHYQNRLFDHV